jgi:hypothetical protein
MYEYLNGHKEKNYHPYRVFPHLCLTHEKFDSWYFILTLCEANFRGNFSSISGGGAF